MKEPLQFNQKFKYQRLYGTISGYTTAYNAVKMGYPFRECVESMLGFCNEVVVVEGCSQDETYQELLKLQEKYGENKLKIYQNEWDHNLPDQDGAMKAFARALCENEFLWQQDLDEVVHEDDYEKIKAITKRFPTNVDILDLPVVECWRRLKSFHL